MIFRELNRYKCKTYLLACPHTGQALLVDPLYERVDRYLAVAAYHDLKLAALLDTHTHADHRSGCVELRELTGAPIHMHETAPQPYVDVHVADGQTLPIGDLRITVLHTPGHTPDSLSLVAEGHVLTADTLLVGGTGRTDFPGGDPGAQYDSITGKLFALPDETRVYPGHDYRGHTHSTIGAEKQSNPRVAGRSRAEYIEVMNHLDLPLPDRIQEVLHLNLTEHDDPGFRSPSIAELNHVRQLTADTVDAQLQTDQPPLVLDVREPHEYDGELGHIPGSRLVPLQQLAENEKALAAYRARHIVTVCRAGVRSTTAAALLTGLGFERVSNLQGGMLAWNAARLGVERRDGGAPDRDQPSAQ